MGMSLVIVLNLICPKGDTEKQHREISH